MFSSCHQNLEHHASGNRSNRVESGSTTQHDSALPQDAPSPMTRRRSRARVKATQAINAFFYVKLIGQVLPTLRIVPVWILSGLQIVPVWNSRTAEKVPVLNLIGLQKVPVWFWGRVGFCLFVVLVLGVTGPVCRCAGQQRLAPPIPPPARSPPGRRAFFRDTSTNAPWLSPGDRPDATITPAT